MRRLPISLEAPPCTAARGTHGQLLDYSHEDHISGPEACVLIQASAARHLHAYASRQCKGYTGQTPPDT